MKADGSEIKNLTDELSYSRDPSWSPDGKHIAFTSTVYTSLTNGTNQLFIMKFDGSDLKQLTSNNAATLSSFYPSWSPDGKYIAFEMIAFNSPTKGSTRIFKIKIDGSELNQLTFEENGSYSSYSAHWSSNGKYIVFLSNRDDVIDENFEHPTQSAYLMMIDGSEQQPLANSFVNSVSWYPKDNFVSISVPESRYSLKTYLVNVEGEKQNQFPEFIIPGIPYWSPSGEYILFKHMRVLETPRCAEFAIIRPDSLTRCLELENMNFPVRTTTPSWSPDGKYVIFSSNLDGDYDLYIVRTDGSELKQLTNLPGDELSPAWSAVP
jgi:TolB protein